MTETRPVESGKTIPPARLAHIVLRTSNFDPMIEWYQAVLGCEIVYKDAILCFMTYDEEHHRVAILNMPDLKPQEEGFAGFHHAAFTYDSMGDLLSTYKRLRDKGIKPIFPINHGPTTSMYYADPDGNQLELQIENYETVEESTKFFFTEAFAQNPIGVEFDPDELLARFEAGESEEELKARPDVGARGLEAVKLR